MTTELVPNKDTLVTLASMARSAQASKFYDKLGGEQGILSIMLLARELDIPPMQALSGGIWNIQGKVEMSARMMNLKIRQSGHKLEIKKMASDGCEITGYRKDTDEALTVSYSRDDAERAGVLNKDTWRKFPREMYFARALSLLARVLFPDVIGNCYVEGEISDNAAEPQKQQKIEIIEESPSITVIEEPAYITKEQVDILRENIGNDEKLEARIVTWVGKKTNLLIQSIETLPLDQFECVMDALKKFKQKEQKPEVTDDSVS